MKLRQLRNHAGVCFYLTFAKPDNALTQDCPKGTQRYFRDAPLEVLSAIFE